MRGVLVGRLRAEIRVDDDALGLGTLGCGSALLI